MIKAVAKVQPLTGIPTPDVLANALISLVRPLMQADFEISEGPTLTPANFEATLTELVTTRPSFSGRGPKRAELTISWMDAYSDALPRLGALSTFMNIEPGTENEVLDSVIEAARLLVAPLSYLDRFDGGFRDRSIQHRDVYQEDKTGADRVFGLLRGFSGIPWRTVLGPASVDFFGQDALSQLPARLATRLDDGYWLLTPCEHPDGWTPETYCDDEREIIETLGRDKFFDPQTNTMPTELPALPKVSPAPVKARVRGDDGEFVWTAFNGFPENLL